jgi:hypothetical protein
MRRATCEVIVDKVPMEEEPMAADEKPDSTGNIQ